MFQSVQMMISNATVQGVFTGQKYVMACLIVQIKRMSRATVHGSQVITKFYIRPRIRLIVIRSSRANRLNSAPLI